MDYILSHYKKTKIIYMNYNVLKNIVNLGWQKMEKYYSKTNKSPAYAASIILNPVQKIKYIDNYQRSSQAKGAKKAVKKLQKEEYKPITTPNANTLNPITILNEYKLWLGVINALKVVDNKYNAYLKAKKVFGYLQPIDYWLDLKQK